MFQSVHQKLAFKHAHHSRENLSIFFWNLCLSLLFLFDVFKFCFFKYRENVSVGLKKKYIRKFSKHLESITINFAPAPRSRPPAISVYEFTNDGDGRSPILDIPAEGSLNCQPTFFFSQKRLEKRKSLLFSKSWRHRSKHWKFQWNQEEKQLEIV